MITLSESKGTFQGLFGLLGHGIKYSLSPRIHNYIFSRYGINAVYALFDLPPQDFHTAIQALIRRTPGFNVTTPYKEECAEFLPVLSREASMTGSVNLVKGNKGYNTDFLALEELVRARGLDLSSEECTIFGSGGAARTAAYLFGNMNMYITVVNRSLERAQKLQGDLSRAGIDARAVTLKSSISTETLDSEVFVNCISYPEFRYPAMKTALAVDFNYASRSGNFRTRVQGKHSIITGEEILVSQAIHSQIIWNDISPDFSEIMEVINVEHTG